MAKKEVEGMKVNMFVYAIHREKVWTTDYNVLMFSSKKMAQKVVEEANVKYEKWKADKKAGLISYHYENPQPSRYRLEKIKVHNK
jgi:hypothetical protein